MARIIPHQYRVTVHGEKGKHQFNAMLVEEHDPIFLVRAVRSLDKRWKTITLHDCYDQPVITAYRTSPLFMFEEALAYLAKMHTPEKNTVMEVAF